MNLKLSRTAMLKLQWEVIGQENRNNISIASEEAST